MLMNINLDKLIFKVMNRTEKAESFVAVLSFSLPDDLHIKLYFYFSKICFSSFSNYYGESYLSSGGGN